MNSDDDDEAPIIMPSTNAVDFDDDDLNDDDLPEEEQLDEAMSKRARLADGAVGLRPGTQVAARQAPVYGAANQQKFSAEQLQQLLQLQQRQILAQQLQGNTQPTPQQL